MSGAGAFQAGGRWNSPGRHVVYAAGNLTLAMLELLVHVEDASAFASLRHVYHEVAFPADAVSVLERGDLPNGWDANPLSRTSQVAGDEWLDAKRSLALAVPSVIVPPGHRFDPLYMNYLIDPTHPEFATMVETGPTLDLAFDDRLAR